MEGLELLLPVAGGEGVSEVWIGCGVGPYLHRRGREGRGEGRGEEGGGEGRRRRRGEGRGGGGGGGRVVLNLHRIPQYMIQLSG